MTALPCLPILVRMLCTGLPLLPVDWVASALAKGPEMPETYCYSLLDCCRTAEFWE